MTTRRLALALPLIFLGWIGVMAVVMLVSDAAPAAVVILPPGDFTARLPADIAILAASPVSLTLQSDRPSFAQRLYGAGAWLVLPAGLTGCLPMPQALR